MNTHTILNWARVTRRNPCPVCGKTDWCRVLSDGTPICSRIESRIRYDNGGWLHKSETIVRVNNLPDRSVRQSQKATVDILNQTYTALLSELNLSPSHQENLRKRGLSDAQISWLNYKTLPAYNRDNLVKNLLSGKVQLKGVPGFWTDPRGTWQLSGPAGICIPVRDLQGNIQGITIRCDESLNGKYKWLSSARKLNGCSSGAPIHVAKPEGANQDEIWITEGPLKADIVSRKLNRIILAVPGVNNYMGIIPILKALKPQRVVLAYDMDKLQNTTVKQYENMVIATLLRLNIRTFIADWDARLKGIDDCLNTQDH
jgi:endogenous inhibitor of DNA gyrase (YacG/DUF329 family)